MIAYRSGRNAAVAGVLAALVSTAAVAGEPVTYFTLGAGATLAGDADVTGTNIVDTEADYDWGPAGRFAIGLDYDNPLRSEIELAQRWNDIDSIGSRRGTGDIHATSLMTNIYYDFQTGSSVTPFIGAGVGGIYIQADGQSPVGASRIDDEDLTFSAQAIAGLMYRYDENWSVGVDYRYLIAPIVDMTTNGGNDVDTEYDSHAVMVSLRYDFAAPPPPMKAEPAPEPVVVAQQPEPEPEPAPEPVVVPRTFLVFFDWDEDSLTQEARDIIASAAQYVQTGGISRIDVTGHADRSGSDTYNLGLSQRRADAVAAEFARLGVSRDAIAVAWKGEREPLVQTEDGVREPQNRRVEIIFP